VARRSEVKLIWKGDLAVKRIDTISYEKLDALGYDIVAQIKEFISQKGTGKMYKSGKTVCIRLVHQDFLQWYGVDN